jgi:hypothetical protein
MKRFIFAPFFCLLLTTTAIAQTSYIQPEEPAYSMLIRADDMGMSHGQNLAFQEFLEAVISRKVRLITYQVLVHERGLDTMERPALYRD